MQFLVDHSFSFACHSRYEVYFICSMKFICNMKFVFSFIVTKESYYS